MSPNRSQHAEDELVFGVGSQFHGPEEPRDKEQKVSTIHEIVFEAVVKNHQGQTSNAKLTAEALNVLDRQHEISGPTVKMQAWMEDKHDHVSYKRSFGDAPKGGQPRDPPNGRS